MKTSANKGIGMGKITSASIFDGEDDRATVHANGIVVDVIANDDGSIYIELYSYEGIGTEQAVVDTANIDRYKFRHPNLRVRLASR